jgi:predicted Holliday junction resolvase-like endonuclease
MSFSVGSPVQVAWVTHDLDATETALTGLLGVKKWVRLPDVHFAPDSCSYLGRPADFVASISLSYLGDMQLEIRNVRAAAVCARMSSALNRRFGSG